LARAGRLPMESYLVADLPSVLLHQHFAENSGATVFPGCFALFRAEGVVRKDLADLPSRRGYEHVVGNVAIGPEPSGDRDACGASRHLANLGAVAPRQVVPRRRAIVDYQSQGG